MKVFISNEGIYNSVRNNISKTKSSLENCRGMSFNVPYGFSYSGFISNINNDVRNMSNKLERINNALYKNDQNYRQNFSDERRNIRNLDSGEMKMRRGL